KISKRFDQDISAVCGCFNIELDGDNVREARLCFGGMAATPRRARNAENALQGKKLIEATIEAAVMALKNDFKPLTDARGSASYRMAVAQNLMWRYFYESRKTKVETRLVGRQSAFG
ncbi:MAG: xanthine dehydrogenase small subunit, partial [Desulfobulbia bacterium]